MLCGIQSVQETARLAVFAFAGLLVFAMTARSGPETEADAPRGKDLFRTNQTLIMAPLPRLAQNDQSKQPSLPSSEFNPDTGAKDQEIPIEPPDLFPPILPLLPDYGEEALPRSLQLPRKGIREAVPRRTKLVYEAYPDSESGAGLPLGAILANNAVAARISPGLHGTTFGGGPLACRVAIDVLAKELTTTMGLCGVNTVAEIDDHVLAV
jgi:hypothetical protein